MNWTTEYPTKPGFYWLRRYYIEGWLGMTDGPTIVQVWPQLDFDFIGDDQGYYQHNVISAEWYGPIDPPVDDPTKIDTD